MIRRALAAPGAPGAAGGYAQAVEVSGARRLLFVSGRSPQRPDGTVPDGLAAQARQAWADVLAQLRAAGMDAGHIVQHRTDLARREDREADSAIRRGVLGTNPTASTVIVAGLRDEAWLIEIEAVAAD